MSDANKSRAGDADAPDLDQLKADIADLKSALGKLIEDVRKGATTGVGREAERLYNRVAESSERSATALAREVEERPLTALLIAFGIGFIDGRLLNR
jgi:ElaB/YqjD/DUF883 family membrane-anchored ribosome-binding protein